MGRKPRIEFKGAIYHVIQRGNNREYIFKENEDKGYFLTFLEEIMEEMPYGLLGYVIMDNHYHLMVESKEIPLHKIMHKLNNQYSKSYNKRYNRSGHVFGERYRGILVQDEKYLLSLLRYIHKNPVRANLCKKMNQYHWSSDQYYRKNIYKLVDIDKILRILSNNRKVALEEYYRFMEMDEPVKLSIAQYEEADVIGNSEILLNDQDKRKEKSLDEILLNIISSEEDFLLIKQGSRKRHLKGFKFQYVKDAMQAGYSFKEIGKNISVSAEAVNKLVRNGPSF